MGQRSLGKIEASADKEKLTLTVDTLRDIEIDVADCNLLIMESEDDYVWISVSGKAQEIYYSVEPYTTGKHMLSIKDTNHHHINWRTSHYDTICLYLPKDCMLDSVIIELGAGLIESIPLKADVLDIDVGAGVCEASSLEGENVSLAVGAGGIEADVLRADTMDMEIGAGEIQIRDIQVKKYASVDVNMGSAVMVGTIAGNLDVECNMGSVQMSLTGDEDDHGYSVDCGMGEVMIGSRKCEGLASERSWNEGKDSQFEVDCSMGNVTILFDK